MPNIMVFREKLLFTCVGRNTAILIVLFLVIATLVVEVIWFCTQRSNKGISIWSFLGKKPLFAQRLSLKQQIMRDVVVIVILSAFLICSAIPNYRDIKNEQYVEIRANYTRNERTSDGNLFTNGHVYIDVNGEILTLELPRGWTGEEFPLGTFYGTVWYSMETKVILAFIPINN